MRNVRSRVGGFMAAGIVASMAHWGIHDKTLEPMFGWWGFPIAFSGYFSAYGLYMHGNRFLRFYAFLGAMVGSLASEFRAKQEQNHMPGRLFWLSDVTEEEKAASKLRLAKIGMSIDASRMQSENSVRV